MKSTIPVEMMKSAFKGAIIPSPNSGNPRLFIPAMIAKAKAFDAALIAKGA